ncbi:sulfotransferase family 2 domain-containing protein [uncultured Cocleimonas sp.]|uniref:sulfotransferase family 2 domain-containing protein n=1 Tax=uncultured Cocleimonas sp. TaxID=1051587 RepID=UPI00260CF916|nr:sulfotransferase family 2 domain-containing protein [uncultured Cocleimonas sp.]
MISKFRTKKSKHSLSNVFKTRQLNFTSNTNVALQQNHPFLFAQKHALNLYQKKAIYSFIPKNGCTTLRTSLAIANGFLENKNLEQHINWVHNNSYTFSANLSELACADYTFTVLRCPYERLTSLFLDKFVDKTPVAWNFYRQTNNKYDLDKLTFSVFLQALLEQPSLINGDIHWRKQVDFLVYQEYDDYFNFDNFDNIRNTLKNRMNLDLIDTREITNHGKEKYNNIDGNFSTTSVAELKLLKTKSTLPSTDSLFNNILKENTKKIYQLDFDLQERIFI